MSTPLPPQGVPPQQPPPGSGYAPHMPTQGFQPSYGSPPPGSRPSRPTLSPAKYGTTLGMAIGGALLGLIALFLPFISISAAVYRISESESYSLLQWNSDIRPYGDDFGFNMFLFSLLVILAAIAFAVLLGLLRRMPKSVSYLAGGGLIGTGLVMFLLWILFLMDMGRLSDLISSSTSEGTTITVSGSIGFYAYFSSLSLLIASGVLVFIFVRSGGSPSAPYSPYGPGPSMPAAGYPANPQQYGYGASVPQAPQQYGQPSPSQAQAGQPYQYQQPGQPWQSPAPAQPPSPNAAASPQSAYPSASEQIQAPGSASSAGAAAPGGTSPGAPFSTSAASAGNPSAPGSPSQPGSPYAAGTPSSAGATYPAGGYGAPAGEPRAPLPSPSPQPSTETSYEPNSYARPDAPRQDLGTDGATGQSGAKSSE